MPPNLVIPHWQYNSRSRETLLIDILKAFKFDLGCADIKFVMNPGISVNAARACRSINRATRPAYGNLSPCADTHGHDRKYHSTESHKGQFYEYWGKQLICIDNHNSSVAGSFSPAHESCFKLT